MGDWWMIVIVSEVRNTGRRAGLEQQRDGELNSRHAGSSMYIEILRFKEVLDLCI